MISGLIVDQKAAAFFGVSGSVNALKLDVTDFEFLSILENSDSCLFSGFWTEIDLASIGFLEFSMSCNIISVVMREENSFEFGLPVLEELVILGDIVLWVNDKGFPIGLDIIAVDCQTANVKLLDVESVSVVEGFEKVLGLGLALGELVTGHKVQRFD